MTGSNGGSGLSRRALLSSLGLGMAATGGCVRRMQSIVGRDTPGQLSLSVKTLPADADPRATRIARTLATNLGEVGIDARVVPMSREELMRDVLLNHAFDLYVAQHPGHHDASFLRPLLHSRFDSEPGWQNPFGYANLDLDDHLASLPRLRGGERSTALAEVQRKVARTQPFSVVAFPDEIRTARKDRFEGWSAAGVNSLESYLSVEPTPSVARAAGTRTRTRTPTATAVPDDVGSTASGGGTESTSGFGGGDGDGDGGLSPAPTPSGSSAVELRMTLTDSRPTENLNPLAVEFRGSPDVTSLLYDPLARYVDGVPVPWLASTWEWDEGTGAPVADVRLREGLRWHDGEPLTAEDVAFTYRFLHDTALGGLSTAVPTPRFRGRSTLVEDVEVLDGERLRVRFVPSTREQARWAFTIPLLPEHVWADRTAAASLPWLAKSATVTEALVWRNPEPVGSGPFRFRSSTVKQSVVLDANPDHFLVTDDLSGPAARFAGGPSIDRLRFRVVPSAGAALELLRTGAADATASPLSPDEVPRIGRSPELSLHVRPSKRFYHVGFNARRAPLSNPRFRRSVARLLDKEGIAETVFDGYATPAATPLARDDTALASLAWEGADPELPFAGSDGELDVRTARDFFREAGYQYVDDRLVVT
jgi:peptide/nickel transport system substrate-binding protein